MVDTVVIYHKDCLDGFGSAYVAWTKFGDNATYIPMGYGEQVPVDLTDKTVFILDFSLPVEDLIAMSYKASSVTVLDHHEKAVKGMSVIDSTKLPSFRLIHSQTQSGVGLTWDYFYSALPLPIALSHIQDRDLWKFQYNGTKAICAALAVVPRDFEHWDLEITRGSVTKLFNDGTAIVAARGRDIWFHIGNSSYALFNGVSIPICNCPPYLASEVGGYLAKRDNGISLTYAFDGERGLWTYSLRSVGAVDVAKIAATYGGGGHKNAAGFTSKQLIIGRDL